VFNKPLQGLDARLQDQILRNCLALLRDGGRQPGIIWVLANPAQAEHFDRVVVFKDAALVEDGTREALLERNGVFRQMQRA
jgi:putative ABC transport system ATP-binding protein